MASGRTGSVCHLPLAISQAYARSGNIGMGAFSRLYSTMGASRFCTYAKCVPGGVEVREDEGTSAAPLGMQVREKEAIHRLTGVPTSR